MKVHRPVVQCLLSVLDEIFIDQQQADRALEKCFKSNRQFGSRDRKFVAEAVFDTVRWRRLFEFSIEEFEQNSWSRLAAWLTFKKMDWPNWPEFEKLKRTKIETRLFDSKLPRAIAESVPDWLDATGSSELGEAWPAILRALNQPAPVFIRANRLKTTREALLARLKSEEIPTEIDESTEDGLRVVDRQNVFATKSFHEGLFEVQDSSSQKISPLTAAAPGLRVVDACAGAGGKTLHLAAMMKNKGKLIAMDTNVRRLEELRKRVRRAGVDVVEIKEIESTKTIKRFHESFDCVLLDAPCTGLGVLRRNPDAKWKLSLEELERLKTLQYSILSEYCLMAKSGGRVVYATCSILPSENENQVARFLSEHGSAWTLASEHKIRPGDSDGDGFYAAVLIRK